MNNKITTAGHASANALATRGSRGITAHAQ